MGSSVGRGRKDEEKGCAGDRFIKQNSAIIIFSFRSQRIQAGPTKGCRRHGKASRVFVGTLFKIPCRIMAGDRNAMRLNPERWASKSALIIGGVV
jgi:hypothetical protein